MTNTTPELKQYAEEAGLKQQDMPPADHPLFQNNAEVRTLSDLIDARSEAFEDDIDEGDSNDGRTLSSKEKMDSEDVYMTLADFEDTALLDSDPDAEAGDDASETIIGAGMDRAPDMTGTVTGIARGMSTHLPLDYGADGFQIIDSEGGEFTRPAVDVTNLDLAGALEELAARDPLNSALADDDEDFHSYRIPVSRGSSHADSADDALDGTRRLH